LARKLIGQILEEKGDLSSEQVDLVVKHQYQHGGRFGEAAIKLGFTDEETVSRALARQAGVPFVNLAKGVVPADAIRSMTRDVVRDHRVLPVKLDGKTLVVAVEDPVDLYRLDDLRFLLPQDLKGALSSPTAFRAALRRYYDIDDTEASTPEAGSPVLTDDEDEDEDAPIIRLVHKMLEEALLSRSSDVHVEPFAGRVRVRYRIDGVCQEVASHPKHLQGPLISRIKILSGVDIAEKRKPQDGRIGITVGGRDIDVRVSFLPATHGESVVMRLLDRETGLVSLTQLGFEGADNERFRKIIRRPNGIVLVTGPTGSGKTTTLYAVLQELNRPDVKIITAENPVEYHLAGINQCEVRHKIGLDFSKILRSMLRQAPNIILVGEIRDRETANIAVQAALTGHLVFSTLHTNDAPSALTRLLDMGVKPFLVATSIQAVLAQRLVRLLCPRCKVPVDPSPAVMAALGIEPSQLEGRGIYEPRGCPDCRNTGYRGRIAVFELMEMDSILRALVHDRAPVTKIREQALLSGGMSTLKRDAVSKVVRGMTSVEEALRISHSGLALR
jgi:type IV pilus assembly protein PilB